MKNIKKLFYILFIIFFILFLTIWQIKETEILNSIVTFLSITTGFTITALSIIATSRFSQILYSIESKGDNSKTLLHELIDKFKSATKIFLLTIALILIHPFTSLYNSFQFNLYTFCINIGIIIKAVVFSLTILSFYKFISLLLLFSSFVIKSVSTK